MILCNIRLLQRALQDELLMHECLARVPYLPILILRSLQQSSLSYGHSVQYIVFTVYKDFHDLMEIFISSSNKFNLIANVKLHRL